MHVLQAHALFGRRKDRGVLDCEVTIAGVDSWPVAAAAGASLSGMLDDCDTDADLDAAIDHFHSLCSIGVVTLDAWQTRMLEIIDELIQWGDACDRERRFVPYAA